MPKITYQNTKIGATRLAVIEQANQIIEDYQAQGFDLTLRQLYYQFVARGLIPNRIQEYKRLGDTINSGRLAGLIDWLSIADRTRNVRGLSHWDTPADIMRDVSEQFNVNKWGSQPNYVEVWIEKDALVGVIAGVCDEFDIPYFSCRGYTSQSEMWVAAQRMRHHARNQEVTILHFGDHDPSGIDMTRDIRDRLNLFGVSLLEVRRLALNMPQVEKFNPPPNPAKETDSRFAGYIREFGEESWELDALEPSVLAGLIRSEIEALLDVDAWQEACDTQDKGRSELTKIADQYDGVVDKLDE